MTRQARARRALAEDYLRLHPGEAAELLESEPVASVTALLARIPLPPAARVLERLTPSSAADVLEASPAQTAAALTAAIDPARAAALLARLDDAAREERLSHVEPAAARELRELMRYPPASAGSFMDPRVTTLPADASVRDVRARLRTLRRRRVDAVFLVDSEGRLAGVVPLHAIVLGEPGEPLSALAARADSVLAMSSREEVVEVLAKAKVAALPVVDVDSRLLGVIRHDALVTAAEEEASRDLQAMVGVPDERALSPALFAVRRRLPWLQINLVTAFLAAAVVGVFEGTIARFTALAVLLPVVAGQSGNTGMQALAVTVRGLALREIRLRHSLPVLFKELRVGLANGVAVAVVTSGAVFLWSRSLGLALVIGLAMVSSMVIAGLAGAAVPLALTALRQDPAASSSIVLTTVTDVLGFFSFLGLATLMAGML